jgi:hypothetical protein
MGAPQPLSEHDLAAARTELAAGRPVPVWFTKAAVGVPAGGSAKVVSIEEAGEGDFIQVKPAGTRDTMFCSPNELTRIRPPRKRAQQAPQHPALQPSPQVQEPTWEPAPEQIVRPESPPRSPARDPEKAAPARVQASEVKVPEVRATGRPRSAGGRQAPRPAEVTLTLSSSSEGEWTVEVMVGKKRAVRPTVVQPADVATAARALPRAVVEAIESSLEAARLRQIERVERLRAELDAAQQALHELSGRPS